MRGALLLGGTLLLAFGCAQEVEPILTCQAERGIRPVCGFQNPEDLAVVPGGGALLVSQMGEMDGSAPGSLARFDTATESRTELFPAGEAAPGPAVGWGAADCPGPPSAAFSPHGLDLARRPDGALRLLVVNHGGREAIEMFEVLGSGTAATLAWRGCAVAPEDAYLNDVASLPDGGFVTTHMFDRGATLWSTLLALLGFDTGFVYEWHADTGWAPVPGTEGAMPNGITTSPDGDTLFENVYLSGEVRRVSRSQGRATGSVEVPHPDNITWSDDGRLFVASHRGSIGEMLGCGELEAGSCPLAFAIVAIDPATLETETLVENAGPPLGAATVAVDYGDEIVLGTFAGDRIAFVELK